MAKLLSILILPLFFGFGVNSYAALNPHCAITAALAGPLAANPATAEEARRKFVDLVKLLSQNNAIDQEGFATIFARESAINPVEMGLTPRLDGHNSFALESAFKPLVEKLAADDDEWRKTVEELKTIKGANAERLQRRERAEKETKLIPIPQKPLEKIDYLGTNADTIFYPQGTADGKLVVKAVNRQGTMSFYKIDGNDVENLHSTRFNSSLIQKYYYNTSKRQDTMIAEAGYLNAMFQSAVSSSSAASEHIGSIDHVVAAEMKDGTLAVLAESKWNSYAWVSSNPELKEDKAGFTLWRDDGDRQPLRFSTFNVERLEATSKGARWNKILDLRDFKLNAKKQEVVAADFSDGSPGILAMLGEDNTLEIVHTRTGASKTFPLVEVNGSHYPEHLDFRYQWTRRQNYRAQDGTQYVIFYSTTPDLMKSFVTIADLTNMTLTDVSIPQNTLLKSFHPYELHGRAGVLAAFAQMDKDWEVMMIDLQSGSAMPLYKIPFEDATQIIGVSSTKKGFYVYVEKHKRRAFEHEILPIKF